MKKTTVSLVPLKSLIVYCMLACLAWAVFAGVSYAEEIQRPVRKPVDVATGDLGIVVSDTPLASQVGRQVLARGGNAVDAAVATAFALAVTWPEAGNIGGGGFMMIAPPEEEVVCVEYRETAPAAVNENSFVDWEDRRHARMAGVPGTVHGLAQAHRQYGRLRWQELLQPSIQLAQAGFEVNEHLAYSLNSVLQLPSVQTDPRYAEFKRVYGHPKDRVWKAGDRLVQRDLAATLSLIAQSGPKAFYEGVIADAIVLEMDRQEGLITKADLQNYQSKIRIPEVGTFQGYTVYGAPPPSSGGITVIMQLRMIQELNLKPDPGHFWNADQVHLIAEVMKRAFRERAAWLGDPDFVSINETIRQAEFAKQLASTIQVDRATDSSSLAGSIPLADGPYESPQTTHFSVIDAQGMAVSNTYTLEASYGCRIVPEGTGFILNNEMGDFNWQPGYTNLQGRIGTKPNLMAPGKRMLSSQSPVIVKQGDKVKLIAGSPGGRTIINTVTEILVQVLLFGRSASAAVDGPRFHHQWFPDVIRMESDQVDACLTEMAAELKRRGHHLEYLQGGRQGSAQVIEVDLATGQTTGVADWRRGSAAAAVSALKQ